MRSSTLIGLIGLLAMAAPRISSAQEGPGRHALLVGVNEYHHEKLPPLRFAENDVSELAEVLRDGGYDVILLTGGAKEADRAPTKANIDKQLKETLRQCKKGDLILVAFAGHGLQFEGKNDAYFCPVDARPFADEAESLVSLGEVYRELEKSFAGMKVLLVDACRNDPEAAGRGARGINADSAPRPPLGVAALFSCRAGERAFEHDQYRHGLFFHHVLEGLKGEAKDRRGRVTFAGLAGYVSQGVIDDAERLFGGGIRQSPNLKADYSVEPILVTLEDERIEAEAREAYRIALTTGAYRPHYKKLVAERLGAWQRAADRGVAAAQALLGDCYEEGIGVPKDFKQSSEWFRKAAQQGSDLGRNGLGACYYLGHGVGCDFDRAAQLFRQAADQGLAMACNNLGWCYMEGRGVPKNEAEAVGWFRRAAEGGSLSAETDLAWCQIDGRGMSPDPAAGFRKMKELAERGVLYAQDGLGWCYLNGLGTDHDPNEAIKWFHKSIEGENRESYQGLASCYENGLGVTADRAKAMDLYRTGMGLNSLNCQMAVARLLLDGGNERDYPEMANLFRDAAQQGNPEAANWFGRCREMGWGVEKDLKESFSWYRKSAELGHPKGMYNLGMCYYNGEGVDKDYAQAARWFRKGAEAGEVDSQSQLGWVLQEGRGVPANVKEAAEWFQKAADQGHTHASARLGYLYLKGLGGLARDEKRAAELFGQSDELGSSLGQYYLATCYQSGAGVERDLAKAYTLFLKSAEGGDPDAQDEVGWAMQHGLGTPKDENGALEWYKKAADQGAARACNQLGVYYQDGLGSQARDPQVALSWYLKAAENGNSTGAYNAAICYLNGIGTAPDRDRAIAFLRQAAARGYDDAKQRLGELGIATP